MTYDTALPAPSRFCQLFKAALQTFALAFLFGSNPAAAQTVVNDTFSRADAGFLGNAETGQPWAMHAGSAGISGGTAALGGGFVLASVDGGITEGSVSVRVPSVTNEFWLIVRLADGANYWRFGRWQGQAYQLQQVVNNALGSPQITTFATMYPQANDTLSCKLLSAGLECSVNGTPVVQTANTFLASATRAGFSGYLADSARLDDFLISLPTLLPDLSVGITGPSVSHVGDTVDWTVTVTNEGTLTALLAAVNIVPPAGVPGLSVSGANCAFQSGQYHCSLGSLNAAASIAITLHGGPLSQQGTVTVSASAPAVVGETVLSQNSASFVTSVHPELPTGVTLLDTFSGNSGTALTTANTGQSWVHWAQPATYQNGAAGLSSGFTLSTVSMAEQPGVVHMLVAQPASEFWLIVRFTDQANYWRFGRWQGQPYQLQRIANNTVDMSSTTLLASVNPSAGDQLACYLGTASLACAVNDTSVATAVSSAGGSSNTVGISGYQASGGRLDDLAAAAGEAVPEPANLSISMNAPAYVVEGAAVSMTATISNLAAQSVTSVTAALTLPASLTGPNVSGAACTHSGTQWSCPLGTLSGNSSLVLTVSGTAPQTSGTLTFSGSVPIQSGEIETGDNTASATTVVYGGNGGPVILSDSFNRANSSSLGTASTGQTWLDHFPGLGIDSGRLAGPSGYALSSIDTGESLVSASVTVVSPSSEFWLVMRLQDGSNYWRFGHRQGLDYQLQQVTAGAIGGPTLEVLESVSPSAGDVIACTNSSAGLVCSVNDEDVVRTYDPTGQNATRVGISGYQASALRMDNFIVTGAPLVANPEVSVVAPAHVLLGEPHTVQVHVQNAGLLASSPGSLTVELSDLVGVVHSPGCTGGAPTLVCTVPSLGAGAETVFSLTLVSQEASPFGGTATISIPGDAVIHGNTASWSTWTYIAELSVIDDFNRPDTTSGLGTSPTNDQWIAYSPGFHISNGTARSDVAGALSGVHTPQPYGTMEVVLGANAATTGIVFRIQSGQAYYLLAPDANGYYNVKKVFDGVSYPLSFSVIRQPVAPKPGDRVRVVTRPDDGIFVTVNGVHIADFGDLELMNATGWGIASLGGPATVDLFTVTPRLIGLKTVDTFELSDGSTLAQPTSGVRYQWRPRLGPAWVVQSGSAVPSTTASYTNTWLDTSTEQATVEATLSSVGASAWLMFRFDELQNTYYRLGYNAGGSYSIGYVEHNVTATAPVAIQAVSSPGTPQAGDVLKAYQLPDGTVECYINDVLTFRFVDLQTSIHATAYGFAAEGAGAGFSEIRITPYRR